MKKSKADLIQMCEDNELAKSGSKKDMAERLLQARDSWTMDCPPITEQGLRSLERKIERMSGA